MYHQLLILVTFISLPNTTALPHLLLGAAVLLMMGVVEPWTSLFGICHSLELGSVLLFRYLLFTLLYPLQSHAAPCFPSQAWLPVWHTFLTSLALTNHEMLHLLQQM